jgi:predicted Fe-Mo cluster-binding NifX family protein
VKTVKVALASTDGKFVNEHFGRASAFLIFDILANKREWKFVEKREVLPLCSQGEHSEEGIVASIENLIDCTAVVVAMVGQTIKRALEINHISVFEEADYIDSVMEKLTAYYARNGGVK